VVDSRRVGVVGISQGGGIALAVSGLVPDLAAVVARVPFPCDFPRASVVTDALPYKELGQYLAKRAKAPLTITAALMHSICPPSTVFGAFNNYAGPKEITLWPYNGHEGGSWEDDALALALRAFRWYLA